jgi:hypothetical protein
VLHVIQESAQRALETGAEKPMPNRAVRRALPSAHEIHDLDFVPGLHQGRGVPIALDDRQVVLDCHPTRVDPELSQQLGDRERTVDVFRFTVQANGQSLPQR